MAKVAIVYDDTVDVKGLYIDQNIYNIYVFNPRNSYITDIQTDVIYKMFTICRYCADGDDLLETINTWRLRSGFSQPVEIKWSFRGNFHKNFATMGVDWYYPPNFHYVVDEDGNNILDEEGNPTLDGVTYRSYMEIGMILNLTWNFVTTTSGDPWLFIPYVKDLHDGTIECIGSGWMGRYDRYLKTTAMFLFSRQSEPQRSYKQGSYIKKKRVVGEQGERFYKP